MITTIFILSFLITICMVGYGFLEHNYPIFIMGCIFTVMGTLMFLANEKKELEESIFKEQEEDLKK